MAAWNAEPFIGAALRSVLEQTVVPEQIVVVDDGSSDATAAIAAGFPPVTVVRRNHAGAGASRNAGLAAARGDVVALLDADDLWLPRKLERQLAALTEDPSREAVFCRFDEFADAQHPPPPGTRRPLTDQAAPMPSTAVLPRRTVDRVGGFVEGSNVDWVDWLARLRSHRVVEHVVPEVLVRRRIHSHNSSFVQRDDGRSFIAVAHQHLRAVRGSRPGSAKGEA